jgi:hypothetical protein
MTEQEWLACTKPYPMLDYLGDRASDRKLMLFSVACLRRIWHLLSDPRSRRVLEVAEEFADGRVSEEVACQVDQAFLDACENEEIEDGAGGSTHEAVEYVGSKGAPAAMHVANEVAEVVGGEAARPLLPEPREPWPEAATETWQAARRAERAVQAQILRDIIPSPSGRMRIAPSERTPEVVALAQRIYEERGFERMPELAAALERAGCTDVEVMAHCRGPGPHVRGCWVVDLLLAKD